MAEAQTRTPRRASPSKANARSTGHAGGTGAKARASAARRPSTRGRPAPKRAPSAAGSGRASSSAGSPKANGAGRAGRASATKRSAARASTRGSNGARGQRSSHALPDSAEAAAHAAKRRIGTAINGAGAVGGNVKGPLIASGAALAGVAGGLALSGVRDRVPGAKGNGGRRIHLDSKEVAQTAKQIGAFSEQLGSLAAEIRRVREAAAAGSARRRSPIEVVLQGLTARR
jgi:hypothetical protein